MSPVLAAALSQSNQPCHPEKAEPLAPEQLPRKDPCTFWTEENRVANFSRSVREVG
jgi:hypothetical protein